MRIKDLGNIKDKGYILDKVAVKTVQSVGRYKVRKYVRVLAIRYVYESYK